MNRRRFLPGVLALVAPIALEAQQADRVARIGVLSLVAPDPFREAFRRSLFDLGYVEGRNAAIEHVAAGGDINRLSTLAAALVRANVHVIVANATPSIQAAMKATDQIPIVMATAGDALRTGLVTNLARPGGNVTGLSLAGRTGRQDRRTSAGSTTSSYALRLRRAQRGSATSRIPRRGRVVSQATWPPVSARHPE